MWHQWRSGCRQTSKARLCAALHLYLPALWDNLGLPSWFPECSPKNPKFSFITSSTQKASLCRPSVHTQIPHKCRVGIEKDFMKIKKWATLAQVKGFLWDHSLTILGECQSVRRQAWTGMSRKATAERFRYKIWSKTLGFLYGNIV